MSAARARGLVLEDPRGVRGVPGKGVAGTVAGRSVLVGNRVLMAEHGVDVASLEPRAGALASEGATPVFVAVDGRAAGLLAVADPVKPTQRRRRSSACARWGSRCSC